MATPFKYLVTLEPLGLLYGSMGKFLSPENLVGRSGSHFPPSAATLSGLFAAAYAQQGQLPQLEADLKLAGPFWAETANPQAFYVPTPLNCLVRDNTIVAQLRWSEAQGHWGAGPSGKFEEDTWINLDHWPPSPTDSHLLPVTPDPWEFLPHLHPRLADDQRRVEVSPEGSGSLFLENAVQLPDHICLVYLSTLPLDPGWYRFGGEGHLVDLTCHELGEPGATLLNQPLGHSFALITPALWGSNRLSLRQPETWGDQVQLLTGRAQPFRYRLGGQSGQPKRLSRGRYAVPAGTIYITPTPQSDWGDWPDEWFPKEGPRLNRWGSGLALPLPDAIAPPSSPAKEPATAAP